MHILSQGQVMSFPPQNYWKESVIDPHLNPEGLDAILLYAGEGEGQEWLVCRTRSCHTVRPADTLSPGDGSAAESTLHSPLQAHCQGGQYSHHYLSCFVQVPCAVQQSTS